MCVCECAVQECVHLCAVKAKCDDDEVMCGGDLPQQQRQQSKMPQGRNVSPSFFDDRNDTYLCVCRMVTIAKQCMDQSDINYDHVGGEDIKLSP